MKTLEARELAAIASIEAALATEKNPEYVVLLRDAKDGHQTALGQVSALIRLEGGAPEQSGGLTAKLLAIQTRLVHLAGTGPTLHAMRAVEVALYRTYRTERDLAKGRRHDVLATIADHAMRRIAVLTWHLDNPGGHACARCLLDRPGVHPPIVRAAPHSYVCAACHDDVLAELPPDLPIEEWPQHAREMRVIEHAIGKVSKEAVRKRVHAHVLGQPPDPLPPPRAPKSPAPRERTFVEHDPAIRTLALDDATPGERAYTEVLFDARALRKRW